MAQWYVKDLSKITGVSVQTLHHYDRIDLLKPSLRLPNGYRSYSETDLLKLQQILSLKFFGFELTQIKTLLSSDVDMTAHFSMQAEFLREKAQGLLAASDALEKILSTQQQNKSITWETIIQLIEVYRMTQQLEQTWAGRVLTPEELNQYAKFESGLKNRFTEKDKQEFGQNWAALVAKVKTNLDQDPSADIGVQIGKEVMTLINGFYGSENANLRHAIWEKGYKKGQMDAEHAIAPEIVEWLDKAIDAFYRGRIYRLLAQAEHATPKILADWNALLHEMCGDSQSLKQDIIDAAMKDEKVSVKAREWLKKN